MLDIDLDATKLFETKETRMKQNNRKIKFTNKGHSHRAIWSLVFSMLSLFWLVYGLIQTYRLGDGSGRYLGGIGTLALLLEFIALIMGIRSLKEQNVFTGIPRMAAAVAFVLFILWAAVYGLGVYGML